MHQIRKNLGLYICNLVYYSLTSRVRSEMKKEEAPSCSTGSNRETVIDERHTQSQQLQLLKQITNNRNVLFGKGKRGKKTKKNPKVCLILKKIFLLIKNKKMF